jgi:hypothetical protein
MVNTIKNIENRLHEAIAFYWQTREQQKSRQTLEGKADQGARSAVTGGAQMSKIVGLLTELILEAGAKSEEIFQNKALELPGFFRPTKEWDLLVIRDQQLVAAIEAKSQAGPSFGNNFNNRTEEAMGSALDLWTAFREGAFNSTIKPWLGYLFLLEDCPRSTRPVRTREPHFPVFPEFKNASYAKRYELFCRKLVRERHYTSAVFLMSTRTGGLKGEYTEPAQDLAFNMFAKSLAAQISIYRKSK